VITQNTQLVLFRTYRLARKLFYKKNMVSYTTGIIFLHKEYVFPLRVQEDTALHLMMHCLLVPPANLTTMMEAMFFSTIRKTIKGLWSLGVGLKVTSVNFFRPPVTVHYPRQVVPSLEGYRGHVELVPSAEDPGASRCIGCGACVRICPGACISIKVSHKRPHLAPKKTGKPPDHDQGHFLIPMPKARALPGIARRSPTSFKLNYNYCSLCGLCVETCPAGALAFSSNIYLAGYTRNEFKYDLLARLEYRARDKSRPAEGSRVQDNGRDNHSGGLRCL